MKKFTIAALVLCLSLIAVPSADACFLGKIVRGVGKGAKAVGRKVVRGAGRAFRR